MNSYGLGWAPYRNHINLVHGYDWIFSRTDPAGPFPPGTVITLKWDTGTTWNATIDGATASWRVEAASVNAIPDGTGFEIAVSYPNATTGTTDDYPWVVGRARFQKKG